MGSGAVWNKGFATTSTNVCKLSQDLTLAPNISANLESKINISSNLKTVNNKLLGSTQFAKNGLVVPEITGFEIGKNFIFYIFEAGYFRNYRSIFSALSSS